MKVMALPATGNSSKFHVVTKHGEFNMALSFTLRTKIWRLADATSELSAAKELAEAIVSRHDPGSEYKQLYIFAEHNNLPSLSDAVKQIRKDGFTG
jgi:hypothetical protein